jgi:hypothetical protein
MPVLAEAGLGTRALIMLWAGFGENTFHHRVGSCEA